MGSPGLGPGGKRRRGGGGGGGGGVVQLVAVLASNAVKKDIGLEIALTLALGAEQGVVGEGEEVVVAGGPATGVHLEPVTSVDSLDIGQTVAQTDQCKHADESRTLDFFNWCLTHGLVSQCSLEPVMPE